MQPVMQDIMGNFATRHALLVHLVLIVPSTVVPCVQTNIVTLSLDVQKSLRIQHQQKKQVFFSNTLYILSFSNLKPKDKQ